MSLLTIHPESGTSAPEIIREGDAIAARLAEIGVLFERWQAGRAFEPDAEQQTILAAYADSVERLKAKYGFESADVISVGPDHPQKDELRARFLREHIHSDFEVRFFVEGRGLFYLHPGDRVYAILCERGDLLSVPSNTRHWFDMGAEPCLKCIRLFTTAEGWVADFTGSDIGDRFPRLEDYLKHYA
ncbi:1,2-dihydroxy-3-keto-5-methylthiopentene dioxygenase [Methylococcus capsulatus]|uniref:1,2-dihydroxy-3-keto-5-methylthiopentene dioxygenase n=1 Tax=Methylococcus capsulatus TaxID=414 RepID=UPI001C52D384|nr:acireductone dioxygenase [Methylococcus capsulatus]QXP88427.1 acireductone dioxygenase [Methylococcus capsulatus]QXP94556.1 acireductone dioxygenase [Methylococcus capsulatus]UQN13472.1 acireductone dioxygenase [Methylococcus capsulatus]